MQMTGEKGGRGRWVGFRLGDEWKLALAAGSYGIYYGDDGDAVYYARVTGVADDDPTYLACRVYSIETPDGEDIEVHRGRMAYPLSQHQFAVAMYRGWPDHPRRVQAILGNSGKVGDA